MASGVQASLPYAGRKARATSMLAASAGLLLLFSSTHLSAVGPSLLMFYGGDLTRPVLYQPGNPSYNPTGFLWNPRSGGAHYGTWQGSTCARCSAP